MSAILVSLIEPEKIVIIKGDKPLEFRYHPARDVLLYASDGEFLDYALGGEEGWSELWIEPMSIALVRGDNLPEPATRPFEFGVRSRYLFIGSNKASWR